MELTQNFLHSNDPEKSENLADGLKALFSFVLSDVTKIDGKDVSIPSAEFLNAYPIFRDYFYGLHDTRINELEKECCYFVLDGFEPIQDFYTSKHVYKIIHDLPNSTLIRDYNPTNSPSPYGMFQIGRSGFPICSTNSQVSFSLG